MNDDVLTRNSDGELSVRTVSATETSTVVNPNDVYTRDTDGKLCIRTVGGSGGGSGDVVSVNGKKGVVVLTAEDVSAIPQYETMPTASASNLGNIVQYIGESGETYTNGYFYKNNPVTAPSSATISQTSGIVPPTATFTTTSGNISISADPEDVENWYVKYWNPAVSDKIVINYDHDTAQINILSAYYGIGFWTTQEEMEAEGFVFSGIFGAGCQVDCDFVPSQGLKNISVDVETFEDAEQPTENETVSFVCTQVENPETIWEKDGVPVTLSDYGISFTGTPSLNDELTVVYLAPSVAGYSWEQINVQPEQNVGIDWKTTVDLPLEYTGDVWACTPFWTVAGGLPDGEYEFYTSTKCTDSTSLPLGEVIYKITIIVDNTNNSIHGRMGYVFNGDYKNSEEYMFGLQPKDFYNAFYKNNNDFIFYCRQIPFVSNILNFENPLQEPVLGCWKMSAIKNINTGKEYIATGDLILDGSYPQYTINVNGWITLKQLAYEPDKINNTVSTIATVADFATNTVRTAKNSVYTVINMNHDESGSEFFVKVYGKIDEMSRYPYAQEIIKATGIFADSYVAFNDSSMAVMGVDTTTVVGLTGNVKCLIGAITDDSLPLWFDEIPQNTTPVGQIGPRGGNLTVIAPSTLGDVIQYVGETNANYTNGYWYKSVGTIVTIPEYIVTNVISPQGEATVTIDTTNWINALISEFGWSRDTIVAWLKQFEYADFIVHYDVDNDVVTELYIPWQGWINSQNVLQYISVSYTGSSVGIVDVNFREVYNPETKEVQNGHWERVNVQPDLTSITGYDATKTQILKNVNGTITWVDE